MVVVVIDGGGGSGGGVMEPGGIVRGPVSVGQHVPLLVSLLFCQPLATQVPLGPLERNIIRSELPH